MNRSLVLKLGAIALLMIVLLVPLLRIGGLIRERQQQRDAVVQEIARSSSYAQQITGPLLVVPYHRKLREWNVNATTRERRLEEREVEGQLYLLPEVFKLDGTLATTRRNRGIYEARLYHADTKVSGHFEVPAQYGVTTDSADYRFDAPYLAMGISDIRGIRNALSLRWNGATVAFEPGSATTLLAAGVHAPLTALPAAGGRFAYEISLQLDGTSQFQVTPVGRDSQVSLESDWPHPSFDGEFLPTDRSVAASGFRASWQTSFFATNLAEALQACVARQTCDDFKARHFGVSFIDPVDQYLKSERAIKYALLFIALTFAGFFLFEVLKKLSVHPIQYGLVGLALALFYLLLLSLSEHIGFALAYGLSAGACVALIGVYISTILQSAARGAGFAAALAALYGLLYGLLSAEDYALLMGSLLLFSLLAAVMLLTRRVNWSGFGRNAPAGLPAGSPASDL
ncbi:MAG: cell envelope integrity protein CreD [Pseudomonadota bacterium]